MHETVELAGKAHRSIVNAILRNALRQKHELLEQAALQPLPVRESHPSFLVERWQKQFGEEASTSLCLWNNQPAPLYARINRLKISVPDFHRIFPERALVPGHSSFVALPKVPDEGIAGGNCYMQDPSTASACELLAPEADERVLDACAAPGGKTAYLAEKMGNRGTILACDRSAKRTELLRDNLARLGVSNVKVLQHDWRSGAIESEKFDRILLDAPCSNTGVMRRRVDVRWRLRPDDFRQMHQQQMMIVRNLVGLLKPGGVLVYSTCSLEREENEEVVECLAGEFPQLKLETVKTVLPFRDGFDGAFAARFISGLGERVS